MKKIIVLLFSFWISLNAFADGFKGAYVLNGVVNGLVNGEVVLSYSTYKNDRFETHTDTTYLNGGKFKFQGVIDEPKKCKLFVGPISVSFYIDACNMSIKLFARSPESVLLTGSKTQNDNIRINKRIREIDALRSQCLTRINKLDRDSSLYKYDFRQSELKKWYNKMGLLAVEYHRPMADFARSNSESFVSLMYLNYLMLKPWPNLIPSKEARAIFNGYSEDLRNSPSGKYGDKLISKKECVEIGVAVPDFCVKDINGKSIKLSDLKGKLVFIDFWASWCGSCISEFPELKSLYHDFHEKGLELLAVSLDENKENWLSAIHKYGIEDWQHVNAKNVFDNESDLLDTKEIEKYPLTTIPISFLIDREGKIIGRWGFDIEEKPKSEFIKSIVDF
jgi:peroxiredoxin